MRRYVFFLILAAAGGAWGQRVILEPAATVHLPTHIDGNTPSFWVGSELHLFSSTGDPLQISRGPSQFGPFVSQDVDVSQQLHRPVWVEAAWRDDDGTIYGWYHHEPGGVCPSLTAPKIGAVVSYDNGASVIDLGIVLESGDAPDCNAKNGFFASGHGDFSVVLDQNREYFYFLFTNYGGDLSEQGIVSARLPFADRTRPVGAVRKYYQGAWNEPGIGGHMTPIFPATQAWQREDADSFWGPAVHWNTTLERYVVLLNRSCCEPGWPQEGIYVSSTIDLADPSYWGQPQRLLAGDQIGHRPGYYPQVMGVGPGETDTLAGPLARLYVHGSSRWQLRFTMEKEEVDNPEPDGPPDAPIGDPLNAGRKKKR